MRGARRTALVAVFVHVVVCAAAVLASFAVRVSFIAVRMRASARLAIIFVVGRVRAVTVQAVAFTRCEAVGNENGAVRMEEPESVLGVANEEVRPADDDCFEERELVKTANRERVEENDIRFNAASAFSPLSRTSSQAPFARSPPPSASPRPSNRSTKSPPAAQKCSRWNVHAPYARLARSMCCRAVFSQLSSSAKEEEEVI